MKNYALIAVFVLLGSLALSAQDSTEKDTVIIDTVCRLTKKRPIRTISKGSMVAYTNCKARDEGHSPLLYRGPELYVRSFRERHRRKINTRIEGDLAFGNLLTRKKQTYYRTSAMSLRADLNYHVLFSVSDTSRRFRWQLGPMLGNVIDTRLFLFLPNNAFSYEFANYIGISTAVRNRQTIRKRTVEFSWRSHMALLAHVIRPNFIGMEPAVLYEGPKIRVLPILFNENKIALPGKFFHLRSELSAAIIRPGKRSLNIFYAWSITVDNLSNPLVQAKHHIGFGRTLTRDKKRKSFRSLFLKKKMKGTLGNLTPKISIGHKNRENPVNHSFLMKSGGQYLAICFPVNSDNNKI